MLHWKTIFTLRQFIKLLGPTQNLCMFFRIFCSDFEGKSTEFCGTVYDFVKCFTLYKLNLKHLKHAKGVSFSERQSDSTEVYSHNESVSAIDFHRTKYECLFVKYFG